MTAFEKLVENFDLWEVKRTIFDCEVMIVVPCQDCGEPLDEESFFGTYADETIEKAVETVLSEGRLCSYCEEKFDTPHEDDEDA